MLIKPKNVKFEKRNWVSNPPFVIGFQMAFPKREFASAMNPRYYTNINADYFTYLEVINEDEEDEE